MLPVAVASMTPIMMVVSVVADVADVSGVIKDAKDIILKDVKDAHAMRMIVKGMTGDDSPAVPWIRDYAKSRGLGLVDVPPSNGNPQFSKGA